MEQTKSKQYAEILCEAIKQISNSEQARQAYDRTILCEIIDDTNKTDNVYRVSDGSTKFDAVAPASEMYTLGNRVYVTIPLGDWSQQKIITGRYIEKSNTPLNYTDPLNTMVDMLETPIKFYSDSIGLIANGNTENVAVIQTDHVVFNKVINNDAMGLKVSFKNNFDSKKRPYTGNYGIYIVVGSLDENNGPITTTYQFDTSQMFGNPYNYFTWFTQTYKFDTSQLKDIFGIAVTFFQASGTFMYKEEVEQKVNLNKYPKEKNNNIFVKDIQIFLGEDMAKLEENTFKIYTNDETEYIGADKVARIKSIWLTKDEESDEFLGFSQGVVDETYDEEAYLNQLDTQYPVALCTYWSFDGSERKYQWNDAETVFRRCLEVDNIYNQMSKVNDNIIKLYNLFGEIGKLYNFISAFEILKQNPDYMNNAFWTRSGVSSNLFSIKKVEDYRDRFKGDYRTYPTENNEQIQKVGYFGTWIVDTLSNPTYASINTALNSQDYYRSLYNNLNSYLDSITKSLSTTNINSIDNYSLKEEITELKSDWSAIVSDIEDVSLTIDEHIILRDRHMKALRKKLGEGDGAVWQSTEEAREEYMQANANKYALYWYQKDAAAGLDALLGESGWRRVELKSKMRATATVPGMPNVDEETGQYEKRTELDFTDTLPSDVPQTSYKAVIFYNHAQYQSNIIEYTNTAPEEDIMPDDTGPISITLGNNAKDNYKLHNAYFILNSSREGLLYRELLLNGPVGKYVLWYLPKNNTMLKPVIDQYLKTKGYMLLDKEEDTTLEALSDSEYWTEFKEKYRKDNYRCYVGAVTSSNEFRAFYYSIRNVFEYSSKNNTIYCKTIYENGEEYETSHTITFEIFGSNGTDYTLTVAPIDTALEHDQMAVRVDNNTPLTLEAILYDANGQRVASSNYEVTWSLPDCNGINHLSLLDDVNSKTMKVSTKSSSNINSRYYIVAVEANYNGTILTTEYPVPIARGDYVATGATTIIYDFTNNGYNVSDEGYELYKKTYNSNGSISLTPQSNITWDIRYYAYNYSETLKASTTTDANSSGRAIQDMMPTLVQNRLAPKKLKPSNFNNKPIYCVVQATSDSTIVYQQPIRIITNQHSSQFLNEWSGDLVVDAKTNTVMAALVGAGSKDDENRFSGVVLGELGKLQDGLITNGLHGLYGYNNGALAFSFTQDGKATIGEGGKGQIQIDGNEGYIQSGNYRNALEENPDIIPQVGMNINLKEGHIDAYNFKLTSNNICLNSLPTEENKSYFQIKDAEGEQNLIYIGTDAYYLCSPIYQDDNGRDQRNMLIDLATGKIASQKFELIVPGKFLLSDGTNADTQYIQFIGSSGQNLIYLSDSIFTLTSNNYVKDSAGMSINLMDGHIDAYNFKLTSSRLILNSVGNPYLQIKGANQDLLYIDDNSYYLQTNNYNTTNKTGTRFDLSSGQLTSYNFSLNTNTFVVSSSGNPYLQVKNISGNDLMLINTSSFYLQSSNFSDTSKSGMKLDLENNSLKAYSGFTLYTTKTSSSNEAINIDAGAATYPLQIGNTSYYGFKVSWDGSVTIKNGSITANSGSIGGCTIDENGIEAGDWRLSSNGLGHKNDDGTYKYYKPRWFSSSIVTGITQGSALATYVVMGASYNVRLASGGTATIPTFSDISSVYIPYISNVSYYSSGMYVLA